MNSDINITRFRFEKRTLRLRTHDRLGDLLMAILEGELGNKMEYFP